MMKFELSIKITFMILLIYKSFVSTLQNQLEQSCTLPDGQSQSICVRFFYCDDLVKLYKQYNGEKPPQDVIDNINLHACGNNLFCCPNNKVTTTATSTTTTFTTTTFTTTTTTTPTTSTTPTTTTITTATTLPQTIKFFSDIDRSKTSQSIHSPDALNNSCILPDRKRQGTCIRLHYCRELMNIWKRYIYMPESIVQNIKAKYSCGYGLFCCPDNATDDVPPRKEFQTNITDQNLPENPVDKDALKTHPNLYLINEPSCGISTLDRVVGGENASLKEYPWTVLLGYQEEELIEWKCGGSLISSQFVLTAAHCIIKSLKIVRLGEHTISTTDDCDDMGFCTDPVQDIKIEKSIKHPFFSIRNSKNKNKNDIGLIKLESPADVSKNNVKTICLPTNENSDVDKIMSMMKKFAISGWGKREDGEASDILQRAFIPYVKNSDCVSIFEPHKDIKIYHTYICAGGDTSKNRIDTCKGDSGGGLMVFALMDNRLKMVLYGVVSGGIDCKLTNHNYPGIYTNIEYYLDWILDNMSQ